MIDTPAQLSGSVRAPTLKSSSRPVSLFLDMDGVLAKIEPEPDMVVAEPWRTALLKRLGETLDGRLAILSGRTIDDIDRIAEKSVAAVAGIHGLEVRFPDGSTEQQTLAQSTDIEERILDFRRLHPEILIENKGAAFSLHYRAAPHLREAVVRFAAGMAEAYSLKRQSGHCVEEIRAKGRNKGDALRLFMEHPPFADGMPVMVGDDLTDEDGFLAAEALGGFGVRVSPQGPTHARYILDGPSQVAEWLDGFVADQRGF
ncbi:MULTISPECIES: trehalose-phosphatase [unclassified Brevundimonas]|uniref:trehalose-phosphatase n=1 Tax=unclassified Brevundimonas TaxID=2622653 RepID=UPI0025BDB846|nr:MULTISPECIES: trehalose-phosphatase [unclassified Brevundimonas]